MTILNISAYNIKTIRLIYIYTTDNGIQRYDYINHDLSAPATIPDQVRRFDSALSQDGTIQNDILSPIALDGITSVVLSGGEGSDTYKVRLYAKTKLKTVLIDNLSKDKLRDILELKVDKKEKVVTRRQYDHLILGNDDGAARIENVFGVYKMDYDHLRVQVADSLTTRTNTYQVADIVQKLNLLAPNPLAQTDQLYSSYYLDSLFKTS